MSKSQKLDMPVTIKGVKFKNPVTVASGTFGSRDEYSRYVNYEKLGAIITKTITLNPRLGNPMPRICETSSGMLNAIGLQNKGLKSFVKDQIPYFKKIKTPLIVSIAGETEEEYYKIAKGLDSNRTVKALEINLSCPNVKKGCLDFQSNPQAAKRLLKNIRCETNKLLFTKLSSEAGDRFLEVAESALLGGTDGLSFLNTIKAMAVDLKTKKPRLANITGGLSGPAIKPVAVRYLYEAKKQFNVPVIAMGGVMNAMDALEFIMVGADLVALGTANFVNPTATIDVLKGIESFLKKEKTTLDDLRGSLVV